MEIYLVGGAIRDRLLGLPVQERDWVVVGATPEEMLDLGYQQVGKDFPVFLHPQTKEEYALARTERKTGPGYKGFAFHASADVSLEEDLVRRDLTINAMAESSGGELIDLFNGQTDLEQGRLRHVSPAFTEDPVRVLRVARFAAKFGHRKFSVAQSTNALMRSMVANGEIDHLVPERVWAELAKALTTDMPEKFFTVLHGCHALDVLFPEIETNYDTATQELRQCANNSRDPSTRYAALMLAIGDKLPVNVHLDQVTSISKRYRVPNDYTQLASIAIRTADKINSPSAIDMLTIMEISNALKNSPRWQQLLALFQAIGHIDTTTADQLIQAKQVAANINAASLKEQSLQGAEIGKAIREKRREAIAQNLKI
ncbi:CCA tRNA nucleotidyltransferase [hydrothermal vent metagenome]|uniref:CCA tRNA nucleotidyltransferase n=1 Tax=hydrothermal vent metagenome TaxID=652676 RepID=A0A3B0Z8L3_9ZZZZ